MNFVTETQCQQSHSELTENMKKIRFGWKHLAAVVTACATLFGLGIHLINTIWGSPTTDHVIQVIEDIALL